MPLTLNRNTYTSTQLNDFFVEARNQIATVLPYELRVVNGLAFDDLSIDETDDIASEIEDYDDILKAIQYMGTKDRPLYIEYRRDPDDATNVVANMYRSSDFEASVQEKEFDAERQQILTPYQGRQRKQNNEMVRGIWSEQIRDEMPLLRPFQINLVSQVKFSGETTISALPEQTKFANGWYGQGFYGQETFSGSGFNEWNIDVDRLTVGTTYTIGNFDALGTNQWIVGDKFSYTDENSWDKFPAGVSPSDTTGSCNQITEDLTSQVNGERTVFTTTTPFATDCLHVYWNGQRLRSGSEYTVSSSSTFTTTFVPDAGTAIFVDLVKAK